MRRTWLVSATAALSIALVLGLGELAARVAGREPLRYVGVPRYRPYMHPHPVLGWIHQIGAFEVAGARATFWTDTSRATAPEPPREWRRPIVLVGDSVTEGYGVPDELSFAWRLQASLPGRSVTNLGTAGYSTLQSLLMMETLFARESPLAGAPAPEVVVYGFVDHHLARNVALPVWTRSLETHAPGFFGPIRVPYALLDEAGRLRRFSPEPWPLLPLTKRSALAAVVVDAWVGWRTRDREAQIQPVGVALLAEMDRLARSQGAGFHVAFLFGTRDLARNLGAALRTRGISFIDCGSDRPRHPKHLDPRTLHPTALQHALYAECLLPHLDGSAPP